MDLVLGFFFNPEHLATILMCFMKLVNMPYKSRYSHIHQNLIEAKKGPGK